MSTNTALIDEILYHIGENMYPIGSIYMSVNSTDPSTYYGGEWERIQDTFLLAAGSGYTAGSSGGYSDSYVPQHNHYIPAKATGVMSANASHAHDPSTTTEYFVTCATSEANNTRVAYNSSGNRLVDGMTNTSTSVFHHRKTTESVSVEHSHTLAAHYTDTTGSDPAGKNMPPYLAVYVWKRIA